MMKLYSIIQSMHANSYLLSLIFSFNLKMFAMYFLEVARIESNYVPAAVLTIHVGVAILVPSVVLPSFEDVIYTIIPCSMSSHLGSQSVSMFVHQLTIVHVLNTKRDGVNWKQRNTGNSYVPVAENKYFEMERLASQVD